MRTGIVALALLATGCASGPPPPAPISPDEVRRVILSHKSRMFIDPDSVRDARIGMAYGCSGGIIHAGNAPDTCVCIEANARNRMGGYSGLKQNLVMLRGRDLIDVLEIQAGADFGAGVGTCERMDPFPELNGQAPISRR